MRINSTNLGSSHLILKGPPAVGAGSQASQAQAKSLGEAPPIILSLKDIGTLAALFAPSGLIGRLKKRLNYLKKKNCKIVPAKGTTACVDDDDVVYLGVDFLSQYMSEEETIAGVLAHEWGHSCALKPDRQELEKLNWNQIFELRRAHETLADETSGRLLSLMGYKPNGMINFLTKGKDTHNLKYHHPELRAKVILYGFHSEERKKTLARDLFSGSGYKNDYANILLDIA